MSEHPHKAFDPTCPDCARGLLANHVTALASLRAQLADREREVERLRAARRETSRDVSLGRVYCAAQEILQYLPVPGWEHSAEASGAYERLLAAVREMKRNVKRRRRSREKRAAAQAGEG
jgi:hypothetical protein